MAEDWPYDDHVAFSATAPPSWDCPADLCRCHPAGPKKELFEFSVMLCHPTGQRMPRARFKTSVRGVSLEQQDTNADGEGWATIVASRRVTSILIEWAPERTPRAPEFPYRQMYFVELENHDRNEAALRRLHNLGFARTPSLRANLRDFQHHYGFPATGVLDQVESALNAYHDQAIVPVVATTATASEGEPAKEAAPAETDEPPARIARPQSGETTPPNDPLGLAIQSRSGETHDPEGAPFFTLFDGLDDPPPPAPPPAPPPTQPAPPQPPPAPPAPKGHQKIGGGILPGTGTAQQKKPPRPAPPPFITTPRIKVVLPKLQAFINAGARPR